MQALPFQCEIYEQWIFLSSENTRFSRDDYGCTCLYQFLVMGCSRGSQLYSETDPLPTDGDVLRPQLWAVSTGHPIFVGQENPNLVDKEWTRTMDSSFLMIGKKRNKNQLSFDKFAWNASFRGQAEPQASPFTGHGQMCIVCASAVRWESTLFVLFLLHVCEYMQAQLAGIYWKGVGVFAASFRVFFLFLMVGAGWFL